ncbi:hypothetical protein HK104_000745, partial [Borealophlyctis nickersoniae]
QSTAAAGQVPSPFGVQPGQPLMIPVTLTPLAQFLAQHQAPPPPVLDHLTDTQLRAMEGSSRAAVMERIRAIQNVQHQLTGVVTQLTQILSVGDVGGTELGQGTGQPQETVDVKGKGKAVVEGV